LAAPELVPPGCDYIGHDPKLVEQYEEEVINADIARKVYDLRTKAD